MGDFVQALLVEIPVLPMKSSHLLQYFKLHLQSTVRNYVHTSLIITLCVYVYATTKSQAMNNSYCEYYYVDQTIY